MLVERACIIGVGLLGGSLGLALSKRGVAGRVVGASRTPATLEKAMALGALDEAHQDRAAAVRGSDLVVVCTPVSLVAQVAAEVAPLLSGGALLTDVGSTKRRIVEAVEAIQGDFHFVGGHPLAGSEKTGVAHAREDLFVDRPYFITPTPQSDRDAVERLRAIAEAIGGRPVVMTPQQHDCCLGVTSHFPHLLACLNVAIARQQGMCRERLSQAIGQGFLDVTRVAAGSGEVWADVLLTNADNLSALLDRLTQALQGVRRWLDEGAREELLHWLDEVSEFRRSLGEKTVE